MALRINQNINALNTHRQLQLTDFRLAKSIERLSSGLRINRSSDDPAGFIISEKQRTHIGAIEQAIRNVGESISLIQTAESAFDEVENLIRTIRALAVHASNTAPNDTAALEADQFQIRDAINALEQIASTRRYGAKYLLNGDMGKQGYVNSPLIQFVAAGPKTLTISDLPAGTRGTLGSIIFRLDPTTTLLQACLVATQAFASAQGCLAQDETIFINGVKIELEKGTTLKQAVAWINAARAYTGVQASFLTDSIIGTLVLKAIKPGADWKIDVITNVSNDIGKTTGLGGNNKYTPGQNMKGEFSVVYYTATGVQTSLLICPAETNGFEIWARPTTVVINGKEITLEGLKIKINPYTTTLQQSVSILWGCLTGIGCFGISVTQPPVVFQIGPDKGDIIYRGIYNVSPSALGFSGALSEIDVRSLTGAQRAIKIAEEALDQVVTMRANLGALQKNLLETTKNSLAAYKENLQAAESYIRDADMALEMVEFTRNQILLQTGIAMLAQANLAPQAILTLLR
jgi:flagellin